MFSSFPEGTIEYTIHRTRETFRAGARVEVWRRAREWRVPRENLSMRCAKRRRARVRQAPLARSLCHHHEKESMHYAEWR